MKNLNNKGFTLLELIIVLTILATLAVAAMQSFSGSGEGAKASVHASNIAQIETAVERYMVDFSIAEADLRVPITNAHAVITKGYLKEAPENPFNDATIADYAYVIDFKTMDINGVIKLRPVARLALLNGAGTDMEINPGDEREVPADPDTNVSTAFTAELTGVGTNYNTYFGL